MTGVQTCALPISQIQPNRIVAGDSTPMEVSFVTEAPVAPLEPESKPEPPQLESMIQPPPPDLPPPAFPVPPPPPAKPVVQSKPPPPQPQQQAAPSAPTAPVQSTGPKTVQASQVAYVNPPQPIYPARSRRQGEKGTVMIRVLIDTAGMPAQATVQNSSGFTALDESALSAVKAARFRPYTEGGVPQAVWVLVPINFVLQ